MADFETHPVGTAARIAGKTIADWIEFARRDDCLDNMVPSDLRQVISAITRANAAAAAAYEVAARRIEANTTPCSPVYPASWSDDCIQHYESGQSDAASSFVYAIRALATPDQTAALGKLIAEAVDASLKQAAFWVAEGMVIVAPDSLPQRMALDSYRKQFSTLVLASKKGGV